MLAQVPEIRQAFSHIKAVFPKWGPMLDQWDELVQQYEHCVAHYDADHQCYRDEEGIQASKALYARLSTLHDAGMVAMGYVRDDSGFGIRWLKATAA